jgi:tight adherence protein B
MWQALLSLTADLTFLAFVGTVFFAMALLAFVGLRAGQRFGENYRETFTETASAGMADMFMSSVDPGMLFRINMALIVVLPILALLLFGDVAIALGVLILMAVLPAVIYRRMKAGRLKRFESQLPDGLTMVAGAMRAGASLNMALEGLVNEQPAPISQEFELLLREQRLGKDFEDSLTSMEERIPLPDFGMLVTALRINREVGGNLAETMESLGDTLRRKAMMEGKIQSLTAQGKLQGIVMTGLPVLLGVLLNFLEPEAMSKLWSTPIGWSVLAVIVVMELLGYFMISKITTIDV